MKPKMKLKLAVDISMTVLLLLLMAYELIDQVAHEWLGIGMFMFIECYSSLTFNNGNNKTVSFDSVMSNLGIRVAYKVERVDGVMRIIVVSAGTDEQVYKEAAKRREKHDL